MDPAVRFRCAGCLISIDGVNRTRCTSSPGHRRFCDNHIDRNSLRQAYSRGLFGLRCSHHNPGRQATATQIQRCSNCQNMIFHNLSDVNYLTAELKRLSQKVTTFKKELREILVREKLTNIKCAHILQAQRKYIANLKKPVADLRRRLQTQEQRDLLDAIEKSMKDSMINFTNTMIRQLNINNRRSRFINLSV